MTDIQLTRAESKKILSQIRVTPKWQKIESYNGTRCAICRTYSNCHTVKSTPTGKMIRNGNWICVNCIDRENKDSKGHVEKMLDALVNKTKTKHKSNQETEIKNRTAVEAKAQPYIDAGLGKPFAMAIARDKSVTESVLDLWEAKWWRQYEVDDILVYAVLEGILPEDDAKWLHTVRCDHEDLMNACINGSCTVEWAKALIDCGFNGDSQAVTSVLGGADPVVVARVRKMKLESKLMPPELKNPANTADPTIEPAPPKVEKKPAKKAPAKKASYQAPKLDPNFLNTSSNSKLSQICRQVNIPHSGTKSQMIWRLENLATVVFTEQFQTFRSQFFDDPNTPIPWSRKKLNQMVSGKGIKGYSQRPRSYTIQRLVHIEGVLREYTLK